MMNIAGSISKIIGLTFYLSALNNASTLLSNYQMLQGVNGQNLGCNLRPISIYWNNVIIKIIL